jgi:hypothetical protein
MYLMDELESSLAASEPRRVHSLLGDRIALLLSEDLLLLVDNDAVATTLLRDDRAKGLWKQNIMNFLTDPAADLSFARFAARLFLQDARSGHAEDTKVHALDSRLCTSPRGYQHQARTRCLQHKTDSRRFFCFELSDALRSPIIPRTCRRDADSLFPWCARHRVFSRVTYWPVLIPRV